MLQITHTRLRTRSGAYLLLAGSGAPRDSEIRVQNSGSGSGFWFRVSGVPAFSRGPWVSGRGASDPRLEFPTRNAIREGLKFRAFVWLSSSGFRVYPLFLEGLGFPAAALLGALE